MNQTTGEGATEDAGAIENRLTLNPDDFPVTQDWEDGETYKLSDLGGDTEIRQISPGEFEVMASEPETAEEDQSEGGEEEAPAPRKKAYSNPAVENLIRKKA